MYYNVYCKIGPYEFKCVVDTPDVPKAKKEVFKVMEITRVVPFLEDCKEADKAFNELLTILKKKK